jgi:hypothetical protein
MMPTHIDGWHWAILASGAWIAWRALRHVHDASRDLAWRPWYLRHAHLAYAETLFRCSHPIALTAKVDRAYRAGGQLHLVELKTRSQHRVYRYDVIELSAQRLAIEGDTGECVAASAYVLTQRPGSTALKRHRVKLLDAKAIAALSRRRLAILDGQVQPCRTQSPALCSKCAYAAPCASLQSGRHSKS